MAVDLTAFGYFLPLLTYLVVFIVSYAVIKKIEMFDKEIVNLFIAFLIATIFVSASGPLTYVQSIVPWFAILIISFVFILALLGFVGFKGDSDYTKSWGNGFAIVLLVLFVISGVFVFSSYFSPYLPWNSPAEANPDVRFVTDWIFSPRVFGAILLIGISALVSFVLVKNVAGGDKGKK
jgi:hypothetical protein